MRALHQLRALMLIWAGVCGAAYLGEAQTIYDPYVVTTIAGSPGLIGYADGTGTAARFYGPEGVAVDRAGNVFVADRNNNTIRKVTPAGVVSTIAGLPAEPPGSADGPGSVARFNGPSDVASDGAGNLYVADTANHTIRRIGPDGVVSTFAGTAHLSGSADGSGSAARFKFPGGVGADDFGNVFVADSNNQTIRKITPDGTVSTVAGSPGAIGTVDGNGSAARFDYPSDVESDGAGNLYVADQLNAAIRKITPDGSVGTLAGSAGASGYADGAGAAARFSYPSRLAVDPAGVVFVTDLGGNTIRKITPAGMVRTLAGAPYADGTVDGTGRTARFSTPGGLAISSLGELYVGDVGNQLIRRSLAAPPLRITAVTSPSHNVIRLECQGVPNEPYRIEYSSDLRTFSVIDSIQMGASGFYYFGDIFVERRGYYRLSHL